MSVCESGNPINLDQGTRGSTPRGCGAPLVANGGAARPFWIPGLAARTLRPVLFNYI